MVRSRDWAWLVSLLMLTTGAATVGCAAARNWVNYPLILGFLAVGIGGGTFLRLLAGRKR